MPRYPFPFYLKDPANRVLHSRFSNYSVSLLLKMAGALSMAHSP